MEYCSIAPLRNRYVDPVVTSDTVDYYRMLLDSRQRDKSNSENVNISNNKSEYCSDRECIGGSNNKNSKNSRNDDYVYDLISDLTSFIIEMKHKIDENDKNKSELTSQQRASRAYYQRNRDKIKSKQAAYRARKRMRNN